MRWLTRLDDGRTLRRLLAVGAVMASATMLASSALAGPPVTGAAQYTTDPVTLTGVCAFDVEVTSQLSIRWTYVFDQQTGVQTLGLIHVREQDTFSANGNTVTGLPFTFEAHYVLEDGTFTHAYYNGVVERIRLPDGTLFLSAGRSDGLADGAPAFYLTPDIGKSGDLAAICAALSA